MKISNYEIDIERAITKINKEDYKCVVLQLPEGLKVYANQFVDYVEKKTNANVIISADPCFGACDVVSYEFKDFDVDFVVQIGHTEIPDVKDFSVPTMFINAESTINLKDIVKKAIPMIKGKKIGLVTTAQHLHALGEVKKILEENDFEIMISEGDGRISEKGQILGCNFSSARKIAGEVDLFLFVGSGNFHPLGLMLSTKKPVIIADPYAGEIRQTELENLRDVILRQRYGAIARSKDAKIFGILVGTKKGQQRMDLAYKIKEKLKLHQKRSYTIALDHFSPQVLESFRDIDCFVSTACPRIAIDDYVQYKTPIITPVELDILLGNKKWENYQFDEIIGQ